MDPHIKQLLDHIDDLAGKVRGYYITDTPGQSATYLMKEQQALDLIASNFTAPVQGLILAEMAATNNTVEEACQRILNEKKQWEYIAGAVELIRRPTKMAINNAPDEASRMLAYDNGVDRLRAMLPTLVI